MLLIIVLAIAVVALAAIVAALRLIRARHTPLDLDLDGDWWSDFESQFRAYAAHRSAADRRLES